MKKHAKVFGFVVRRYREEAELSQEALADRAGLHRTYISLLERGLRTPSLTIIKRLAEALGTSMTDMVKDFESDIRTGKNR